MKNRALDRFFRASSETNRVLEEAQLTGIFINMFKKLQTKGKVTPYIQILTHNMKQAAGGGAAGCQKHLEFPAGTDQRIKYKLEWE
jgi:hypothetical protein